MVLFVLHKIMLSSFAVYMHTFGCNILFEESVLKNKMLESILHKTMTNRHNHFEPN